MTIEQDMTAEDWSPASAVEAESPISFTELVAALTGKRQALARELDKGVVPDAFKKGQALLAAYDAAIEGLGKARDRKYPGN